VVTLDYQVATGADDGHWSGPATSQYPDSWKYGPNGWIKPKSVSTVDEKPATPKRKVRPSTNDTVKVVAVKAKKRRSH